MSGITKQYLKYVPMGNANIITSSGCNIIFVTLEGQEGRFVAAAASEHVYIWDLKRGEKAQVLSGENVLVTCLAASPDNRHIAVGYANGTVKTFDLVSGRNISIFEGHKSEITALAYDHSGFQLATGSQDTDIVIWDIVGEIGICRLQGHKGVITKLAFMREHKFIISSSKDTFVKFWDLDIKHNFKTLVGHRSEVWSFVLVNNDQYLITGCNHKELYVWKINYFEDKKIEMIEKELGTNALCLNDKNEGSVDTLLKYPMICNKVGSIVRSGDGRVISLETDSTGKVIGCCGSGNFVELFYLLPDDVVKQRYLKRLKKQKRKAQNENNTDETKNEVLEMDLPYETKQLPVIQVSDKVKGFNLIGKGNELRLCVGLNNNSIELYCLSNIEMENMEVKQLRSITMHGHRTNVRAVCFSSDNLVFATVGGDSVKLWNRSTLACLRTVQCSYAVTLIFVPGDRYLIVGLKSGKMLIVDIATGDILEEVMAHSEKVQSLALFPDLRGIASGGDKTVKFWNFELVEDRDNQIKAKVLSLLHTRTLKLEVSVSCVRISPNNKFLAVSLEDATVKVFILDTFKFFVSLYGHKSSVRCMDISSDSTLLITGSDDNNVKIWGLDFGICHKSIFAHNDSVTGLSFVPETHYFFSSGKDGKVKQWDADIFQKIITLQGHAGKCWNCSVSPNGDYVASCGSDKVVRLYEKTNELLVLEDEGEEQENELATNDIIAAGQQQKVLPSIKTVNSEKAAELILECLEVSKEYEAELSKVRSTDKMPSPPVLMQAYNCTNTEDFLLEILKQIKASDLDQAVTLIPYPVACDILQRLPKLLESRHADRHIELLTRVIASLVDAYFEPLQASPHILPTLEILKEVATKKIDNLRDILGFNLHGMLFVRHNMAHQDSIKLLRDAVQNSETKKKRKRNKEKAIKRAVMHL